MLAKMITPALEKLLNHSKESLGHTDLDVSHSSWKCFVSLEPGSVNCWSMLVLVSLHDLHIGCITDARYIGHCNNSANTSQALRKWAASIFRTIFGNF